MAINEENTTLLRTKEKKYMKKAREFGKKAKIAINKVVVLGILLAFAIIANRGFFQVVKADSLNVELKISQSFSDTSVVPTLVGGDSFSYRLTPLASNLVNPMPNGTVAGVYDFVITGNDDKKINLDFSSAAIGLYSYELRLTSASSAGYTLDQKIYYIEIIKESATNCLLIIGDEDKKKVDAISYQHSYNYESKFNPSPVIVSPTIYKTVEGNPAVDSVFTFKLVADNASQPMPAGSVGLEKTITITGSGQGNFGEWSYTSIGVYRYTIYEVNSKIGGYSYDKTIYYIIDTVEEKSGDLFVNRVITNDQNRQVTSCTFVNSYKTNDPNTGDNSNYVFFTAMLFITGLLSLTIIGYLRWTKKDK